VPPHAHGPARPPAELLAAAQEAAQAVGCNCDVPVPSIWLRCLVLVVVSPAACVECCMLH
jgi:hypothetical protein